MQYGIILKRALGKIKNNMDNEILLITFFSIAGYLISAMFGNSMYYTSPYFFIILGFLMCEINDKRNEKNEAKKENIYEK